MVISPANQAGFFVGKIDIMRNHAESATYKTYRDPTAVETMRRMNPSSSRRIRNVGASPINPPQFDIPTNKLEFQAKPVTLFSIHNYEGLNSQLIEIAQLDGLKAELRLLKLKKIITKSQYSQGIKQIYYLRKDIKARNKTE